MGAGKILCIIGGIVTLLATYLFSFGYILNPFPPPTTLYFSGIGFIQNIILFFQSADPLTIVLAIVFIIFLLAGVFILIGVKSRALAIIGSLFAIVAGVYFMLSLFMIIPIEIGQGTFMFMGEALVDGIIPLHVGLGSYLALIEVGLGTYILIGGGVLGLVGGIMGPDGF